MGEGGGGRGLEGFEEGEEDGRGKGTVFLRPAMEEEGTSST